MINHSEFAKRLLKIMEYHQLSASAFADRIQVQRSSISHLLSGRNKPSLDFVLKVVKEFNEVELYWLLNGKGSFPHDSEKHRSEKRMDPIEETKPKPRPHLADHPLEGRESNPQDKGIERIVVFYSDGTFKAYST
jgi:transcriptional regulator with XRE-family HTH domain